MNFIENAKTRTFLLADGASLAKTITDSILWIIGVGGIFMALWGILQLVQSGKNTDSNGKMEASWLIIGGIAIIALAGGTAFSGILSNPPGTK